MNTIRIKGSFKKMNAFMRDKEPVFNDDRFDLPLLSYYDYLLKFDQSLSTVLKKLQVAYVFLLFLFDNNYEIISMSKGIIFSFISEIDSLERSFSFKDHFKLYLRLFMNWTYENKISDISGNQVLFKVIIHRNTSLKTYYTADEVSSILNAVDISTPVGKQDYLILSMISFLGLRISDVIDMKLSSIDFSHSLISIKQYKTSEPLVLPLVDNVKYPLLDYLKNVRPNDCNLDYIFVTSTKPYRHKSELRTHSYIVKKYIKLAGINIDGRKTGFHALRHSLVQYY